MQSKLDIGIYSIKKEIRLLHKKLEELEQYREKELIDKLYNDLKYEFRSFTFRNIIRTKKVDNKITITASMGFIEITCDNEYYIIKMSNFNIKNPKHRKRRIHNKINGEIYIVRHYLDFII